MTFFGLICFCNWISASTSENGCEREESTWVNEWLAVCLMWRWMKEWGNGACQSFFPLPVRKVESYRSWLTDVCCLHWYVGYKSRGETTQGLHLNASNKSSLTEGGHWIIICTGTIFIFTILHYIFAHTLHLSFCMKVSPDLFITTSFGDFFFVLFNLVCLFKKVSSVSFLLFNEHNNRTVKLGEVRFSLFAND